MTQTRSNKAFGAFKPATLLTISDAERFQATITGINADNPGDPFGSILNQQELTKNTLLISQGANKAGRISFKIAIGVAWRSAVIQTNITSQDHPLNMGVVKFTGPPPRKVDLN